MSKKIGWDSQRKIESAYESASNVFIGYFLSTFLTAVLLYADYDTISNLPSPEDGFWAFFWFGLKIGSIWTLVYMAVSFVRGYLIRRYNDYLLRNEKRPKGLQFIYWVLEKVFGYHV